MSRIFISYSRSDKSIVDDFIDKLQAAGHQVWLDRAGIRGGEQWRQEIVEAIEENDVFLLVLSKNSLQSDHVRTEVDLAKEGRKWIIPVDIQPVEIPTSMKYQLAGLQRIKLYSDEYGFQQLLETLGGASADETIKRKWGGEGLSRGQNKARNGAVLIAGIATLVLVVSLLGYQSMRNRSAPPEVIAVSDSTAQLETQSVSATHPAESTQTGPGTTPTGAPPLVATDLPLVQIAHPELTPTQVHTVLSAEKQRSLAELTTIEELEPLLLQVNIRLSEPIDEERTRSYFYGPESAYHMLAVASLTVVGERRFIKYINLDIVDKWYTDVVGSGYAARGPLDLEIVAASLVKAHNDYWTDNATSLDELLEPLN